MKRTSKILLTTAIAAGLAATTIAVTAAPGYGRGDCAAGEGRQGSHPMMGERFGGRHQDGFAEQRLEALHDQLGITAAQQPAWDAFAAKAKARQEAHQGMREERRAEWQASRDLTPAERLEQRVERMGVRLTEMTEMAANLKALYAELTPEQQAIFSEAGPGFGGGPRHGGDHRGMGHHGDSPRRAF